jgi:hypothetical protein
MSEDIDVARRLLAKLRSFVSDELDAAEAEMFASLLAPGVSRALGHADDNEVSGFGGTGAGWPDHDDVDWGPDLLPAALGEALRESGARVVGLGE